MAWSWGMSQGISFGNCSWWNFQRGSIQFLDRYFDYITRNGLNTKAGIGQYFTNAKATVDFPLGATEIGAVLYGHALSHNPDEPRWLNRDRAAPPGHRASRTAAQCPAAAGQYRDRRL